MRAPAEDRMQQAEGVITVVQEGRFLLAGDDSRAQLFTLAPDAGVEPQHLPALRGRRVAVDYEPGDGANAARAHRLIEIDPAH